MKDNLIQNKSFEFAIRIVNLYKYLKEEKKEYVLSKQILRSGTSIGANIEEGLGGQSKKDFIAKLQISLKEARETHYWLRLLKATNFLTEKETQPLTNECKEIINILSAILKTAKSRNEK
ncbi:MAG: four helix bundle protein [Candidatus Celaenobacter polaris]|nr:four helix bundle protein [Candidatus Celaenobacter polaris]